MNENTLDFLGQWFMFAIVLAILFEAALLGYAYFNADSVNCTWLWCEFTDVKEQKMETTVTEDCYVNGKQVNCSKFREHFYKDYNMGVRNISNVYPGINDNRTYQQFIKELKQIQEAKNNGTR